jgi:hypothetical protein
MEQAAGRPDGQVNKIQRTGTNDLGLLKSEVLKI